MREKSIALRIFLLHVIRLGFCQVNITTTSKMSLSNVTSSPETDSSMSTNSTQTPYVNSTQAYNSTSSRELTETENVTTQKANDMTSSIIAVTQTSILSTSMLPSETMSLESTESLISGKTVDSTETGSVKPTQSSSSEVTSVRTPLSTVLMTKLSTRDKWLSTDFMTSEKSMITSHKMMKHPTTKRVTTMSSAASHTRMKAIDDVTISHPNATGTIIVSIFAVVFFVAIVAIGLICVCRRKNKRRNLMVPNQPPTVHASHRKLDFENLNDASSPGEFLMDKTIVDLESPNTDDNALQALALLDHATEEFGSKEIITFKTDSQEQLGKINGDVPNKLEHASDSDSEEENSEPDEKDKADDMDNKEDSDTKAGDSAVNKEYTNGEKMEKELVSGIETKPEEIKPTSTESNTEPKDIEISAKEESENQPITGSETKTKTEEGTKVSEL